MGQARPSRGQAARPHHFAESCLELVSSALDLAKAFTSLSTMMSMSPAGETKYNSLPQNEAFLDSADENEQPTTRLTSRPQRRLPTIILQAVVVFFALLGIVDILRMAILQPWSSSHISSHDLTTLTTSGYLQTPHQRSCRCGTTVEEAKSNKCIYDSMAAAWLPPHCVDFELLREWEKAGDGPGGEWEYFADQHREKQLTLEEVAHLPQREDVQNVFFVSMAWHVKVSSFPEPCLSLFSSVRTALCLRLEKGISIRCDRRHGR